MIKKILISLLVIGLAGAAAATTYYVNCNSGDAKNQDGYGTSEAYPWKNVTYAMTKVLAGDLVLVAAGTYNTNTGEAFPISIPAGVYLKSNASPSILASFESTNVRVVTLNAAATIEGFTVRSSGNSSTDGAIYFAAKGYAFSNKVICTSASTSRNMYLPDVADNSWIEGNTLSLNTGTNIYLNTSADNVTIISNTIEVNTGDGIYLYDENSNYKITNNIIRQSGTDSNSCGIYAGWNDVLTGDISSNEVAGFASGIYTNIDPVGTCNIFNNTVVNFTDTGIEGGSQASAIYNVSNNIVSAMPRLGNFTGATYGIAFSGTAATRNVAYNDVWNNDTSYSNCSVGTGDISRYPRFVSPEANDYRIFSDSPCAAGIGRYAPLGSVSAVLSDSYVQPGPDDGGGDGSSGSPWKTAWKGLRNTEYAVHANAGTYNSAKGEPFASASLTLAQNQTLISAASPSTSATLETGDIARHAIILGSGSTLEGLTVNNLTDSGSYYALQVYRNSIVRNNLISFPYWGIILPDSSSITIEGNRLLGGVSSSYGIHCPQSTVTDDLTIRNNTIEAHACGLLLYQDSSNYKVTNNRIKAVGTAASSLNGVILGWNSTMKNGEFSSNEVSGFQDNVTVRLNAGYTINVFNNTLVNHAGYGFLASNTAATYKLRNNIISASPRLRTFVPGTYGIGFSGTSSTRDLNYNDVWNNEWNYDSNSPVGANDISRYPRFVSPEANDFRIYADSPCAAGGESGGYLGCYAPLAAASSITPESYVIPGPDDGGGDGSSGSPWKTVLKGLGNTEYTVYLGAGSYTAAKGEPFASDSLYLAQNQKLRAADLLLTSTTTIDSSTADRDTIIAGSYTTVEGIMVNNDSNNAAVKGYFRTDIKNNLIRGHLVGIDLSGYYGRATGNDVSCHTVSVNTFGIYAHTDLGHYATISNNNVYMPSDSQRGIFLYQCDYSTVSYNTVEARGASAMGIRFTGSGNTGYDIHHNLVRGANAASSLGITLNASNNGLVRFNEVRNFATGLSLDINSSRYVTAESNTVVGNTTGVTQVNPGNGYVTLRNNIIAKDPEGGSSSGTGISGGSHTSVSYSDVYGNAANYSGISTATATIAANARFKNSAGNDYNLNNNSPCIDRGDPASSADPDGSRADMGAYPYNQTTTITPCVYVITPNSGEALSGLSFYNITWYATKDGTAIDHIELYYSTNGGSTYPNTITNNTANTGTYAWRVPNITNSQVRVKVVAIGSSGTDESDGNITLTATSDVYVNASTGSNDYTGTTSEVSGSNGPWKTITWASTQAATSSTIHVAAGTYNSDNGESFPITIANQKLISTSTHLATIEEDGLATTCINLETSSLEGFCIEGNGSDKIIYLTGNYSVIKNNIINASNYSSGIEIHFASYSTFESNVIYSAYSGFYNVWGDNIRIYRNEIRDCTSAGVSNLGSNTTIDRNTIVNNRTYGVFNHPLSTNLTIKNNIISNQPVLDDNALAFSIGIWSNSSNASLSHNNVWKNDTDYYDLSAGATDISQFPGFVSPEADDYRLQASNAYWTNPCIGAGEGGVNIGCYDGSVEAGVPYRTTSYVSGSGVDATGDGTSESTAWRTLTKSNKYSISKINIGAGLYNADNGESDFPRKFGPDRWIKGADRNSVTIEAGAAQDVLYLGRYSSLESTTIKGTSGTQTILINGTGAIVKDNIINASGYTYGIYADQTYVTVEANIIRSPSGYGISSNLGHYLRAYKNEIRDSGNAGILFTGNNVLVERNTVVKCHSYGIYSASPSNVVRNNIVINKPSGSAPDFLSYGIYQGGGALNTTYDNSWNNYGNWEPASISGVGTISASAKFVDIANNDYHLAYNSPCIDRGDPASALDPDGSRADLGCYPYDQTASATPCVYMMAPSGGENLTGSGTYEITWSATHDGTAIDHIELYYSTDSGATYPNLITAETENDGAYLWLVPNLNSTTARIKVLAVGSAGTDESDSDFSITASGPSISVTLDTPHGGETWRGGTWNTITWESTGTPDSFRLYYLTSEAEGYQTITTEASGTSYVWLVPNQATSTAKVSIEAIKGAEIVTDESDAVFTITHTRAVINCLDSGSGSLRQALLDAQDGDEIIFNITTAEVGYSGGDYSPGLVESSGDTWFRIITESALELQANNVFIHGSTQSGEVSNSKGPEVEVRRSSGGSHDGLWLYQANNCTIEGLVINGFNAWPTSAIKIEEGGGNAIKGCYLGTNAKGDDRFDDNYGIYIVNSSSNVIGGTTPADRNLISGSANYGVCLENSTSSEVRGNYIGVGADGVSNIYNSYGIGFYTSSFDRIGPDNIIACNNSYGLYLNWDSNNVLITRNTMEANGDQGIHLDFGANNGIARPVIKTAQRDAGTGRTTLAGQAAAYAVIEIFKAEDPPDVYDQGEGKVYLGSAEADALGNWLGTVEGLALDDRATATATDPLNDTSEFALNAMVESDALSAEVKVPNGGEIWTAGRLRTITWKALGFPDTCRVYYTTGEGTWKLITEEAAGIDPLHNYGWLVADEPTSEAKIVVQALKGEEIATDESDAVFTIRALPPYGPNVVTNCDDDGPGSLRYVLTAAETAGGNWEVAFAIDTFEAGYSAGTFFPGLVTDGDDTWFRIIVNSQLPTLTQNDIFIHGSTQTNEAVNSRGPEIEVRCDQSKNYNGFYLAGNNCTLEGMAVNSFQAKGRSGIYIVGSRNSVSNNYVGPDAVGGASKFTTNSIGVTVASGGSYNLIGGTTAAERNVISWNNTGVWLTGTGTGSNEVKGNYIGTNRTGNGAAQNSYGVKIDSGAQSSLIGGAAAGERNILSANYTGVWLSGTGTDGNRVQGNYIGCDVDGLALGNDGYGVLVDDGAQNDIIGQGNLIANNNADGVRIAAGSACVLITQNSMEANVGKGIFLETGANHDIPYPVINSASKLGAITTITGTATPDAAIELFKSDGSEDQGEGQVYLGSTEATGGNWMFQTTALATGEKVTATATKYHSPIGDTSEFALNVMVEAGAAPFIVTNCNDTGLSSLRWCIQNANSYPGPDVITFNIPTSDPGYSPGPGVFRITSNNLTSLTDNSTYIYGSSQASYTGYTNPYGPQIFLAAPGGGGSWGISIEASYCTIEGLGIVRMSGPGIYISGSHNHIINNYLGCRPNGQDRMANGSGILIYHGAGNIIGGRSPSERNLISGNNDAGIELQYSLSTEVVGNYVGCDRLGASSVGNGQGILFTTNDETYSGEFGHDLIGGGTADERNIISGNNGDGIHFEDNTPVPYAAVIKGNYVGVNADGSDNLGNGNNGIYLSNADKCIIGSIISNEVNVVSGNKNCGIEIAHCNSTEVYGNYVGTFPGRTTGWGNGYIGLYLHNADAFPSRSNLIGSGYPSGRNIISGNSDCGIYLEGSLSELNEIKGNFIGVDDSGNYAVSNGGMGIGVNGAIQNLIKDNTLKNNGSYGIGLLGACSNILVTHNTMEANSNKGIYLESGSNNDLPYPTITSAFYKEGKTTIAGTTEPNAVIEIFQTENSPGPDDQGEGKLYLGSCEADPAGNWVTTVEGLAGGKKVTATASIYTEPGYGYTSEFALNALVGADVVLLSPNGGEVWKVNTSHDITWSTIGGMSSINIYYTTGESWIPVSIGTSDSGTYPWTVPNEPSTTAKVSIEAIGSGIATAESNDYFTIAPRFVVFNTQDDGDGSLRQCLNDANAEPGPHTILFNVPISDPGYSSKYSAWWIVPLSPLPAITNDVVSINGTSQKTYLYTNPYGPEIFLNSDYSLPVGLSIEASSCTVEGLGIVGMNGPGIFISGSRNHIINNYIGCYPGGQDSFSNAVNGIWVYHGAGNVIGGRSAAERNLISGNWGSAGIFLQSSLSTEVIGNYIGCDRTGNNSLGNSYGIQCSTNGETYSGEFGHDIIGGGTPQERNIISGNGDGIHFEDDARTTYEAVIKGNYIGVNAGGSDLLGNNIGIYLSNADKCVVGGTASGEGNFICGNGNYGLEIVHCNSTEVYGNYIGSFPGKTTGWGNGQRGIFLHNAPEQPAYYNLIGNGDPSGRNIISGNGAYGIFLAGAECASNEIKGNYIGLDESGTISISNIQGGIGLSQQANQNLIKGNVISGNGWGLFFYSGASSNEVKGNYIGTDKNGTGSNGNAVGVYLVGESSSPGTDLNLVGPDNIIAFNSLGVFVDSTFSGGEANFNQITMNSMFSNINKGIVLLGDQANQRIAYPTITAADLALGIVTVSGTAPASALIELFLTEDPPDASGYGEGKTYLGSTESDGLGNWNTALTGLTLGSTICATATDSFKNTSEFSQNATVEAGPDPFSVTNCGDSGKGSLRWCIQNANSYPGPNTIVFNIASGEAGFTTEADASWWKIVPLSALPSLTDSGTYINGSSQKIWYGGDPNPYGPEIELDGSAAGGVDAFSLETSGCTIEGLVVNQFVNGIRLSTAGAQHDRVIGCYIGVKADGSDVLGNSNNGIFLEYADNCTIGGINAGERNVICGNGNHGIEIAHSNSTEVYGNYFGTFPGTHDDYGNSSSGIYLHNSDVSPAEYNLIGNGAASGRNIIAGNDGYGIFLEGSLCASNEIKGNYIGLDDSGAALGNSGDGIRLYDGTHHDLVSVNLIATNDRSGVHVGSDSNFIVITRNTMEANGDKGIHLEVGANHDIPYPVIAAANYLGGQTTIIGTAAPDAVIEIFKTENSPGADNQGEGKVFLGSTEATGKNWMFQTSALATGEMVTATATKYYSPSGDTSEFALNATVEAGVEPFIVTNCNDAGTSSLRWCITNANSYPGSNTIVFNIPDSDPGFTTEAGASWWRIKPNSALPILTDSGTFINGSSQKAWYTGDPNPSGPEIELDGSAAGGVDAIGIEAASCTIEGLVVNQFVNGIRLSTAGAQHDRIIGCYVGTDVLGTSARANNDGILIEGGTDDAIGGSSTGEGNVICGNNGEGIRIQTDLVYRATFEVQIKGNYIGVKADSSDILGNSRNGIFLVSADHCTIGGTGSGEGNIICGNGINGIEIAHCSSTRIYRNYIGTFPGKSDDWGNSSNGILLENVPTAPAVYNLIGDGTAAGRNYISGNDGSGIALRGGLCASNEIKGNYIGLTDSGDALGNSLSGIGLVESTRYNHVSGNMIFCNLDGVKIASGGKYNIIGGTTEAERNVIGLNNECGILLTGNGNSSNEVKGNYIGTSPSGGGPAPNVFGVAVERGAQRNLIGDGTSAGRNIISGNSSVGVVIYYGASSNEVKGNYVGTDKDGTGALGNAQGGVFIVGIGGFSGANFNTVGPDNIIAFNGDTGYPDLSWGVAVDDLLYGGEANFNRITRNSIFSNYRTGIHLGGNANQSVAYPTIVTAEVSDDTLTVSGTAPATARIELFLTEVPPDAGGRGGGKIFLGSTEADGLGNWATTLTGVTAGSTICATATDGNNNTSEFAINLTVIGKFSPTNKVTSPNGGEKWQIGRSHNITWNSSVTAESINIYYTTGETWTTIVSGTADAGTYLWTVPDAPTTEAKIRVEWVQGSETATDESDGNFSITQALAVTLQTPNGGETWQGGTWENITWEAAGSPDNFRLYYKTGIGGWNLITSVATGSSYTWLVPNVSTAAAKVSIEAVRGADIATDESNSAFTITAASDYYVDVTNGSNAYNGLTSEAGVLPNGPWKTLTYASTMSAISSTIHVAPGTYTSLEGEVFPITIQNNRLLLSTVAKQAILDAQSNPQNVINLSANSTVDGMSITTANTGYYCLYLNGSNATLKNSYLYGYYGLQLETACSNAQILNNRIVSRGAGDYGLYLKGSGTISSNEVSEFCDPESAGRVGVGVYLDTGGPYTIDHNTIVKNYYGIVSRGIFGGTATVKNNIISAAPRPGSLLGSVSKISYGIVRDGGTINFSYNTIYNNIYEYNGTDLGNNAYNCPRFINPDGNDYRLASDSPCINSAQDGSNRGCYGVVGNSSGIRTDSYVDDSGNDTTGAGTLGDPWRTVSRALSSTESTVYLRTGTYTTGEVFPIGMSNRQQLKRYLSETATLEAVDQDSNLIDLSSYCTIEGLTINKVLDNNHYNVCLEILGSQPYIKDTVQSAWYECTRLNLLGYSNGLVEGNKLTAYYYIALDCSHGTNYLVIRNNTLTNYQYYGIYMNLNDGAIVENNTITAPYGLFQYSGCTNNQITNNRINSNNGTYGIYLFGSGTAASNEVIQVNSPTLGAIHINGGGPYTLDRNTIAKSKIGISTWVDTTIKNCIVTNDPADDGGTGGGSGSKGIVRNNGAVNVTYTNVYGNQTNYEGALTTGAGTISATAQFANIAGDDYHLNYNSPCIDSGDPASSADPDGSRADLGCYAYNQTASATPSVYVLTPTNGESMNALGPYNITWYATHDGYSIDHIELYYSTNGGTTYPYTISADTPNDGIFEWTVPNTPTTLGKIKAIAVGSAGTAESGGLFTILGKDDRPPTVEVTSPSGGQTWKGGSLHDITFTCTDESGIKANSVNLYYTSGESWVPIATGQATNAAYPWTTPLITSSEVKIKVTVLDNSSAQNMGTGESLSFFTIDSTPPSVASIVLKDIVTGSTLETSRLTVTIEATGVSLDAVSMRAAQDAAFTTNSTGWITYLSSSQYTFTSGNGTREAYYQVRDAASNESNVVSADIWVDTTLPAITGLTLKDRATGNTSYTDSTTITVEAAGVSGTPEAMRLARDSAFSQGDTGWKAFANPTEFTLNTGEGTKEVFYKLRNILSVESTTYNSNITLDTIAPTLQLLAPNGGERLSGLGGAFNIRWNSTDPTGFPGNAITLRYSINSGATWNNIAAGLPNTGTYTWTVPAINSSQCRISIEASDHMGHITSAQSAGDFIVDSTRPEIVTVIPTNGAASVLTTSEVTITFSKEMSREAVQNAFSMSASPPVAGTFNWNTGGTIVTFRPTASLAYLTSYTINLAQTAADLAGNQLASAFSSSFTTISQGDVESPHCVLQIVDRDRQSSTLKSGDYISKRPWFRGVMTDNLSLDQNSIKLYLDDALVSPVVNVISPTRIEVNYQPTSDLEDETVKTHTLKLEAKDNAGNAGDKQIEDLKVSYGTVRVIGPVLSYPQTFKPKSGTPAKLVYNLTADADIMIYLFSIAGENVWSAKCLEGGVGGRAGYNEVIFDGRSLTNGTYLGNGIYVYKITSNSRVIGTGYITIYE